MDKEKGYLSEVSAMTLKYKLKLPPKNPLIFYGSSNFKNWHTLEQDFVEYNALNHGFGGSNDRDLIVYADKLVLLLYPKTLVLNTSSNDVYAGFKDDEIFENRKKLLDIFSAIENVVVLSVIRGEVSEELEKRFENIDKTVEKLCENYSNTSFLDVTTALDRTSSFVDNHHLNDIGRKMIENIIKNELERIYNVI